MDSYFLFFLRTQLALPGKEFDSSHMSFLGVMEASRQRIEFQVLVTESEENRDSDPKEEVEEGDDEGGVGGNKNLIMPVDVESPLQGVQLNVLQGQETAGGGVREENDGARLLIGEVNGIQYEQEQQQQTKKKKQVSRQNRLKKINSKKK